MADDQSTDDIIEEAASGGVSGDDDQARTVQYNPGASTDESNLIIPDEVRARYPELVELIKGSQSMTDDERNYWLQTLLIMTDEQVKNLEQILSTERTNLEAIDRQAQEELNEINKKQVAEWKEFEAQEKKKLIKEAEKKTKTEEAEEQERLLDELDEA